MVCMLIALAHDIPVLCGGDGSVRQSGCCCVCCAAPRAAFRGTPPPQVGALDNTPNSDSCIAAAPASMLWRAAAGMRSSPHQLAAKVGAGRYSGAQLQCCTHARARRRERSPRLRRTRTGRRLINTRRHVFKLKPFKSFWCNSQRQSLQPLLSIDRSIRTAAACPASTAA